MPTSENEAGHTEPPIDAPASRGGVPKHIRPPNTPDNPTSPLATRGTGGSLAAGGWGVGQAQGRFQKWLPKRAHVGFPRWVPKGYKKVGGPVGRTEAAGAEGTVLNKGAVAPLCPRADA